MSELHTALSNSYYETTAIRAHEGSLEYYERCADGLYRWLRGWLPEAPTAKCLDLASGCGEMMYLLQRLGYSNSTGVDICQSELEQARHFLKGDLVNEDILTYLQNQPTETIDFVSALNILEHLPKDKLYQVLREVRRVLRRDGVLVAMVPNAVSPFGALTRHWDITHEWAFTTNNFRQLASLIGFGDVAFRECGPKPHGIISALRYLLWHLIRLGLALRFLVELGTTKDGIYTMDMLVRLER